jgi:3alpha(or 20beta)-hydroxysteroid dehydrogenase
MSRFDDRVVFITGGARGMGEAHVRGFHAEGAKVVIADVLDEPGEALAAELGDRATYVHLDVSKEDQWQAAIAVANDLFGTIDVLVNNAGILRYGSVEAHTIPDWRLTLEVNLTGTFLGMHFVLPQMRAAGKGSVVNIASIASLVGNPDGIAYGASKWGVRGLTKGAANDMAHSGVRVNAVHPGFVRTPLTEQTSESAANGQAIARFAEPDEITRVVMFVASDDASYSTGADFVVDGGSSAGPVGSFKADD